MATLKVLPIEVFTLTCTAAAMPVEASSLPYIQKKTKKIQKVECFTDFDQMWRW